MVHSTLPDRWEKIRTTGALWSSMRLKKQGVNFPEIGFEQLGEPEDFREYIVLGTLNSTAPEHVVASHTRGCVFTEEDTPYEPGVRLYFNAHRIIRDGLAVRDGLHKLKIHDHLNLEPYLIAAVGVKDVDPEGTIPLWTPRVFLERANNHFNKVFGHNRP